MLEQMKYTLGVTPASSREGTSDGEGKGHAHGNAHTNTRAHTTALSLRVGGSMQR